MKGALGQMMQQAQRMQENLKRAQEEIARLEITGESGAGLVKVTLTGKHQARKVEIAPDGSGRGIWAMQDVITWDDRHPTMGWKAIVGHGHYHETYRREDGAWRIATLTLTRLSLDITWPDSGPGGHQPT